MDARILIINPNSSQRCSDGILAAARRQVQEGVAVQVATALEGPAYIETLRDEVVAASAVLRLFEEFAERSDDDFDAFVIACSSDPGLEAVRETFPIPVLGIGESALVLAHGMGRPFAILTNVEGDEPATEAMARRYGLERRLVSVQAAGFSVEDFDCGKPEATAGLLRAGERAVNQGARALCLGCAAMAGLEPELRALEVPVFEGVACAVRLASEYIALSPRSKVRGLTS